MGKEMHLGRKLTRQDFLLLSVSAGAGFALTGCGGGQQNNPAAQGGGGGKSYDGPKVELAFWNGFTGGDGPYMRKLVERFNAEHDNINVKMNAIVWDEFYQKLPTATAVGEGPQVAALHNFQMGTMAARGVASPLGDVAEALNLSEDDFPAAVWDAGIYDGQRYGIPLDVLPFGLFYNKKLLQRAGLDPNKPPHTRDELTEALDRLKEEGIKGLWIEPGPPTVAWIFQSVLPQFGGTLFNSDRTEATFNSDAGVEALSWMTSLVEQGYSPKNVGSGSAFIAFQNGENAFYWSGGWNINPFKETQGLEFGVAPPPRIGSELATWAASHNFVLPRQQSQDANKLQASRVFVNWMSRNSAEWAKAGQVPANETVRESKEFQSLEYVPVLAKTLEYAQFSPVLPGYDVIENNALAPALNDAVLLNVEPKPALDQAAKEANSLLEENREKYQE